LLIAILALGGILVGSGFYFSWWMNRILASKLRDLDEVRFTGLPPERWRRGTRLTQVRRLDGLTRFVRKTKMVEDDQVRHQVLDELARIRGEWVDASGKGEPPV